MRTDIRGFVFFLLFISSFYFGKAQSVYLSKYVSGNYLTDSRHQLELFNATEDYQNLSGYTIVTRQYVLTLPNNTIIPPQSSLSLSKSRKGKGSFELAYDEMKDFMIRISTTDEIGDYVVMFNRYFRIVDAFYYAPRPRVEFLSEKVDFFPYQRDKITFDIPTESASVWNFLQMAPDPAVFFVKINGTWRVTSKRKNMFPATAYTSVDAKYVEGIVTLKWVSKFEEDCFTHIVERKAEGESSFKQLEAVPAKGNSQAIERYAFYDETIGKNQTYQYRVYNVDKFGNVIESEEVEVKTEEASGDFSMNVILSTQLASREVNIRFFSRKSQQVGIKLLDEQFRELSILFSDTVEANSQNLIKYTQPLPLGKYYLIADTEQRRFYKEITIR